MTGTTQRPAGTATTSSAGIAVAVRDLHVHYGEFEAVRGIDLDVRRGEVFALLGTNGAGKTTTLEVLEGFGRRSGGTVSVLGLDPATDRAALRQRMGVQLQEGGFVEELTVQETLELWQRLVDRPDRTQRLMERFELGGRRAVPVGRLSGGEKRRLDLALAVWGSPELVVLDEPTTGLDPGSRRRTWDAIQELQEAGRTVVLTTHYLEEAERLADRLSIMHRGEVRIEGTLAGVLAGWGDRVSFLLPEDVRTGDLPELPDAEVAVETRDQALWATYTAMGEDVADRAHHTVAALLGWATERGITLKNLQVRGASLEDVFLRVADGAADLVSD